MNTIAYLGYFFYLASNWNLRIAFYLLRQEIKGERKYGIRTTGADELKKLEDKGIDITHATVYMPVSYDILEELFEKVNIARSTHFIDIGCGKGRALCVAAYLGCKKVTGIDFSEEFCQNSIENLEQVKVKKPGFNSTILNNDAFYYGIPGDADVIFLFNPFDEVIMSGVVENIMESLSDHPRHLTVIYANPLQQHLFLEAGFKKTFYTKKLKYLEGIILEYVP